MSQSEDQTLKDAELTEGLFERDAQVVLADFGGQTVSNFRKKLSEQGTMDLMFSYSIISGKGLAHFLPAVIDYSSSADSEGDDGFQGLLHTRLGIN